MGQDRVLGSSAEIKLMTAAGPVTICEIDEFTAKRASEQKTWQPLGQVGQRKQDVYQGYELTFKGGRVNVAVDALTLVQDAAALAGLPSPRYTVVETIKGLDGVDSVFTYPDALLYGFEKAIQTAGDDIKESFSGFAQLRV